ncbi:hypothetical protein [Streptomyces niveus]|uniref:hypothetical protein n=1 Tax=Streptomyces niveus TaxID=193462 RepID=UPI0036C28AA4
MSVSEPLTPPASSDASAPCSQAPPAFAVDARRRPDVARPPRASRHMARRPGFAEYAARTNDFLPLPPRKG